MVKRQCSVRDELAEWFVGAGRVVVAGIGNPVRRDDFVGVKIVQGLEGKVPKSVWLVECETVPESYMQEIVEFKPSHVLLVDAAFLRLKPGGMRLVFPEEVAGFPAVTTHVLPLRIFCEFVAKMSGAKVGLLLVEPEDTEFGEGLTPKVQAAAEEIEEILLDLLA